MTQPRNIVGPIIRELREEKCLTQGMLVARLNLDGWDISRETLAKVETQIRWVADFELVRLAKGVSVDPGELLLRALKRSQKRSPRNSSLT
jgi:hypothetical protein